MIMRELVATKMVVILKMMGVKSAESISIEDACKLWSRTQRAAWSKKPCWRTSQAKRRRLRRRAGV